MKYPGQESYNLYIGGEWVAAEGGATLDSTNPANGEFLAKVANASEADVDKAVKAAQEAFESYSKTTPMERAKLLNEIADIIEENAEHLAMVETLDNGKPIRETSAVDVPLAADHFRYFAGAILAEEGSANYLNNGMLSLVLYEPIGVVGQVIPWNFPFLMAAWKLAPALAAGDTVVLKPSSTTSLSILEFIKLVEEVLPAGVINVVTGSGSKTGQYVLDHPGIAKLAFTGSTEVGKTVAHAAAERLVPSTLELGGKSANIVFEDADWDEVIDGIQLGILFNQGQVCCAGSRIFVQESIYDEFVEAAVKAFENVNVGLPWNQDTQMGSQIDERQLEKILSYIELAKEDGATILTGGERLTADGLDKGAFMAPTLIADQANHCRVSQEEIFGPVAVVIPFKDEEDVIAQANDSIYGLGGGVWTKDINRALRVASAVQTGRIWVNTYNAIPEGAPFGGYKQSGIGRENHKMMLKHYSQIKNIMIDLSGKPSGFYPEQ